MHRRHFSLAALAAALLGYWSPWLTHPAAALRLNGYELSEWVTLLPGVRDGTLAVSRLLFLAPLGCLALLAGLAAGAVPASAGSRVAGLGSRLALLGLGVLLALLLVPPWPYVLTAYADPEYQAQFFAALAALAAVPAMALARGGLNALLQGALAAAALAVCAWALPALRPTASGLLNAPWPVGPGWPVALAGFAVLALGAGARLFSPRAA